MKILFVNTFYAPDVRGGAEVALATLAAALRARGHQVTVATTTAEREVAEESIEDVRVVRLPLFNVYQYRSDSRKHPLARLAWHAFDAHNFAMARSLGRLIDSFVPDVICFHNLSGFSASAWQVARQRGVPSVQILHDYYHLCPRTMMFRQAANCQPRCGDCRVLRTGRPSSSGALHAVAAVSNALLRTHLDEGLFRAVPLRRVIHNAVPWQRGPAREYSDTARTFGFIGTIGEHKGVRDLLVAFRRLVREPSLADSKLLIAGDGEVSLVKDLAREFQSSQVEFIGKVKPEAFYPRLDATIVPSIWREPFGLVGAESQLFGVPVIAARSGGLPEVVTDDVTGLLYDPEDPAALESCMRRLALTPGLSRRLGHGAHSASPRFADVTHMVTEHLALYEAAIQTARRAQA